MGNRLSLFPMPSTAQNPDFLPTKNCPAVEPLSTAGHPGPWMVSVATVLFRLGMLSAGFGALWRLQAKLHTLDGGLSSHLCGIFKCLLDDIGRSSTEVHLALLVING